MFTAAGERSKKTMQDKNRSSAPMSSRKFSKDVEPTMGAVTPTNKDCQNTNYALLTRHAFSVHDPSQRNLGHAYALLFGNFFNAIDDIRCCVGL